MGIEMKTYRSGDGNWHTTVTVADQEQYDTGPFNFGGLEPGSLAAVRTSLQAIWQSIPEECRAMASCRIDSVGGYEDTYYARIEVYYVRPATPDEIEAAMLEQDREWQKKEFADRALYDQLKARFG